MSFTRENMLFAFLRQCFKASKYTVRNAFSTKDVGS